MKRFIFSLLLIYSLPIWSYLYNFKSNYALKKIVIDPGHGGKDPGNLGTGRYENKEKDIVLDISLKLGKYITENLKDVEVIYTRKNDSYPELYERTSMANSENADLFISIHCDAFQDPRAYGSSSFVLGLNHGNHSRVAIKENPIIKTKEDKVNYGNFNINSPEYQIEVSLYQKLYEKNSLKLAELIQTQFRERVKRRDRGVKREPLYVTSRVAMPSVLIELGFLTNKKEEDFLNSKRGKEYMASAIYRAVKDYKNIQDGVFNDLENLILENDLNSVIENEDDLNESVFFSIQIFTSSKKIDPKEINNISNLYFKIHGDTYKYYVEKIDTYSKIKEVQKEVISLGYGDCFIVAFHNNKKINLKKYLQEKKIIYDEIF